jgi:Family of unknown function (DUF6499)
MFYDIPARMKPAPSRGFVTTFYVTYGAQSKAALYRWEFLRRNPQYRADYNEFMRRFGAWLKGKGRRWPPSKFDLREYWTKSQQRYFRTKIEPVLTQLCLKWQISDLFSPDFGLEEDRQIEMRASMVSAWSGNTWLNANPSCSSRTVRRTHRNLAIARRHQRRNGERGDSGIVPKANRWWSILS